MQVSPIFDSIWKTMRRSLKRPVGVACAVALLVVITYQLASKPATAQGVMYALSGKAAKSATAKPLVFAVQSAARIIATPDEALSWPEALS